MSIITNIGRLAAKYRHARNIRRTERLISGLPNEIRKDIGWPDAWERPERHKAQSLGWYGN